MSNAVNGTVYPMGRVYITNADIADVTVTIETPLISGGSGVLENVLVPTGQSAYVTVGYDFHMAGSGVEDKGIFFSKRLQ